MDPLKRIVIIVIVYLRCLDIFYLSSTLTIEWGFTGGSEVKVSACNAGDLGSIPGSGRFPWRRKWQPIPVFLPGESHGQRNLVGYSPWGRKELDTTIEYIIC